MAITLVNESVNREDKIGDDNFEMTSGQSLKIKTSLGGEEILDVKCPAGKKWLVHVAVVISEYDA